MFKGKYRLGENGLNVSNYHMEISNDPVELALVLDDSGSMHYNLKLLIKAVKKFIGFLEVETAQPFIVFRIQ